MIRLPKPPQPEEPISEDWFLCHRGALPSAVAEIVAVLTEKHQAVTVQDEDGLARPFPELRALVQRQAESRRIIVLLNEHLPGPVFRQTFAPVKKAWITCIRVADCDLDGVDWLSVDLADVTDAARRQQLIGGIVRDRSKEECR